MSFPESLLFLDMLLYSSFTLFGLGLFTLFRSPAIIQKIGAFILVAVCFSWTGGFEYF